MDGLQFDNVCFRLEMLDYVWAQRASQARIKPASPSPFVIAEGGRIPLVHPHIW
jgi:hypothetical protein